MKMTPDKILRMNSLRSLSDVFSFDDAPVSFQGSRHMLVTPRSKEKNIERTMKDNRDALDYGEMRIPRLFRKLFFPTLLGLVSSVLLNLADGIFVGRGVPLFLLTCLPFTLNIVLIGYLQSLERYQSATIFMLSRGFILIIPSFILLPRALGVNDLWLAEPLSETITLLLLVLFLVLFQARVQHQEG